MELIAAQRPFLHFPLRNHFEQRFHVAHRLDRYRAGRLMDFDHASAEVIAQAIAEEIGRDVDYRPVETDGARRAATDRRATQLTGGEHTMKSIPREDVPVVIDDHGVEVRFRDEG